MLVSSKVDMGLYPVHLYSVLRRRNALWYPVCVTRFRTGSNQQQGGHEIDLATYRASIVVTKTKYLPT